MNYEKAHLWEKRMLEEGLKADQIFHNTMLNLYAEVEKISAAEARFKLMLEVGIADVFSFVTMIKLYSRTGRFHRIEPLFEKAKAELEADEALYAAVVHSYAAFAKYDKMMDVYHESIERLGFVSFRALSSIFFRAFVETNFAQKSSRGRTLDDPTPILDLTTNLAYDVMDSTGDFPGIKILKWMVLALEAGGRGEEAEKLIVRAGKCRICTLETDGFRGSALFLPGETISINAKSMADFRTIGEERRKRYVQLLSDHIDFHIKLEPIVSKSKKRAERSLHRVER